MKSTLKTLACLAIGMMSSHLPAIAETVTPNISSIETGFREIPDSTRLAVYWYWLNDNLSAPGVVKDLQSMKKAGINRAYIGFQGIDDIPQGKVPFRSAEW